MADSQKLLHINLAPGEAGRYAIVPGDPDRCELIAAHLDNPRMVTRKREFTTWEGTLEGERVTVTSTGIGGPSTAICVEELHKCGADTFIRVGTCASTCADVQCGDIVVVSGSVRMDGTSLHYLPMEFPAVPSYQLLKALEESSVSLGFHTTVGVSITKDSFYTQAEPETKPVSDDLIRRWQSYVRGGAVCTSMEESILFSVGSSLGIRTASILVSATNFDGSVSKRNSADVYPTDSIQKPILAAVEALRRVDVILAAASPRNDYSRALETARPHLRPDVRLQRLEFPMTHDKATLRAAWEKAAGITRDVLRGGENAAFLTIGDPLVYSTFGYLLKTLRQLDDSLPVEIIPGITSFQAAAARTRTILCESHETLCIIPGIRDEESLTQTLEQADSAVILKAYRNFPAIVSSLRRSGRLESGLMASHVEQPEERLAPVTTVAAEEGTPPYMSLILSRKK